jgi:hypothetical protein
LARTRSPLADRIWDTACLAHAYANLPFVIANDHHHAEPKTAPALDHFGYTRDIYDTLVEFLSIFVSLSWSSLSTSLHYPSKHSARAV